MKTRCAVPAWLSTAVFYEVYPQSFLDTNADGIGDLPGILAKLGYIQSLGCNVVWLNPCFESPFRDAGYDISDYYKVAPRYGTNEDLCELFSAAKKRGMRVVLDLVPGHTSSEHPWFKASCQHQPNKYTNWYIWTSSAWESIQPPLQQVSGYCDRDGNYMTNFFHFQPALNYGFASPDQARPWQFPVDHADVCAVREEMKNVMKYWLERGADGFRVDMASSLIKGDGDGSAMIDFWRGVRAWLNKNHPEAGLIAEWSMPRDAIKAGFHVDFMIHFGTPAYTSLFRAHSTNDVAPPSGPSFFHRDGRGTIRTFLDVYLQDYRKTKDLGFISLPTGNHDISRIRGSRNDAELKVVYAFLLTMPGVPCIYQGDEIGMRHIDNLPSKEGGYCRTGARTPMQWNSDANAGFSKAAKERLYLPIDPSDDRPTVAAQDQDENSLLNFVRKMIRLRFSNPALAAGAAFKPLHAMKNRYPFVYLRTAESGEKVIVAINPSASESSALIKSHKSAATLKQLVGENVSVKSHAEGVVIHLQGFGYAIFKVDSKARHTKQNLNGTGVPGRRRPSRPGAVPLTEIGR